MYDCKTKYDLETTSLNFVTNARFNIKLADKTSSLSKDNICIVELTTKDKDDLRKKIIAEHALAIDPIYEDISFLKVLDLSLEDSQSHTKGKISEFLETLFPDKKFHVSSVYRMLFDEVKRRANYNKDILSYDELLASKAIGKSQFENIINATGINKNYDEIWGRLEFSLQNCGLQFQEVKKIKQAWSKLELERMDPNNNYLFKLINIISIISKEQEAKGLFDFMNLADIVESVLSAFLSAITIPLSYDNSFIKAIILSEIYE